MFSDYCLHLPCYFHYVSTDMSPGLLQVFIDLGNLHGTSIRVAVPITYDDNDYTTGTSLCFIRLDLFNFHQSDFISSDFIMEPYTIGDSYGIVTKIALSS